MDIKKMVIFTLDYDNLKFNITEDIHINTNLVIDLPNDIDQIDSKNVLFEIRKRIDNSECFPAEKVILNVIHDENCCIEGKNWKLFSMVLESIKHFASYINHLSIYNCSLEKSTFLSFLKVCVNLECLIIDNSFFDKTMKINNELITSIPFIKILKINDSPEIKSNSKTLDEIIHFYRTKPLESLSIAPYFSSVNRNDIELLIKHGTILNLNVFPQSNFWNENETFKDLPINIHTDSLDIYFYYKIFRKQFIFAPLMFLLYPFAPIIGQYIYFITAFIIAFIFLPIEDLLPCKFHLPIHSNHYRHNKLLEKYEEINSKDKVPLHYYRALVTLFLILFLFSLYSMVVSIFSKSWIPWFIYITLTLTNIFMYRLYIDYVKKIVQ